MFNTNVVLDEKTIANLTRAAMQQAEEIKAARDSGNEKSVNDREQWFRGFAFVLDQLGYTLVWEDNTHVSVKTLMWAMNH